ncbi:MAG TPA: GNAT family N-acetyltransferase [Planctomycetia bacterium]|nr:GNAT family N-acetyltransferase [Planctomycetia bacterium]
MELEAGPCRVRSLRDADAPALAELMNERAIWLRLRDGVPHPYLLEHAKAYLAMSAARPREESFAIEAEGKLVGGIGCHPREDVHRLEAEVGYWVAIPCWGRGYATAALTVLADRVLAEWPICRLTATVYSGNPASCRVLEKCGFEHEGIQRAAIIKDGRVLDAIAYARVDEANAAKLGERVR